VYHCTLFITYEGNRRRTEVWGYTLLNRAAWNLCILNVGFFAGHEIHKFIMNAARMYRELEDRSPKFVSLGFFYHTYINEECDASFRRKTLPGTVRYYSFVSYDVASTGANGSSTLEQQWEC